MEECIFTDLTSQRNEIRDIDHAIVKLISERIEIAKQIGDFKIRNGIPIKNFQVEKQVIDRAKKLAIEEELDPDFVEIVFTSIIRASVEVQNEISYPLKKSTILGKVLIIGGAGKMGNWFDYYFTSTGYQVVSCDPRYTENNQKNIRELPSDLDEFDFIIVTTPLEITNHILEDLINRKPRGIIIEITSMKSHIISILQQAIHDKLRIISCHPMFGPDVNNLSGRNILIGRITESNTETQNIRQFKALFDNTAVNLTEIPIEEHDRIMLYSLTISHLLNLIMGLVITKSPYSFKKLNLFSSTTFQKQLKTMIEVFEEDPKLYHAIQHINVYREDLFLEVQEAIINLQRTTKSTDPTSFSDLIQEVLKFIEK